MRISVCNLTGCEMIATPTPSRSPAVWLIPHCLRIVPRILPLSLKHLDGTANGRAWLHP
jgi:hypothetical protein